MKKLLLLFSFPIFTISLAGQVDLEAGLVAYFPFSGNAEDASIFENHASQINGAVLSQGAATDFEGAYYFDGDNDYIEIPHQPQLDFGKTTDAFSISIWVKPDLVQSDTNSTVNDFLGKWNSQASVQGYDFGLRYNNHTSQDDAGKISFVRFDGPSSNGCGNSVTITSSDTINDGSWSHIVITRNNAGLIELFIDNQLQGSFQDNGVCTIDNMENITLGVRTLNLGVSERRSFQGSLDQLRIYNRVLSHDEINAIYYNVMVSVNDFLSDEEIFLTPNPITGQNFQVVNNTGSELQRVEIFDLMGRKSGATNNTDLPVLEQGTYIFLLYLKNGQKARQRVVYLGQ